MVLPLAYTLHRCDRMRDDRRLRRTDLFQYPFRRQTGRQQHHWQTGARVGARADEVQIMVAAVAVLRPQVTDLPEGVAEAERGTFRQIIPRAPVARGIAHLELQMLFQ